MASFERKSHPGVPSPDCFRSFSGVFEIEGAVLFVDLGGTSRLVAERNRDFSIWVLKEFLACVSLIVSECGGVVSAFEGDGVMIIFTGSEKERCAAKCAFRLKWEVDNRLQPRLDDLFPDEQYQVSYVAGIDSSGLSAVKTGIWKEYDLLWVGRAANCAANLTKIYDVEFSTYITADAYEKLASSRNILEEVKWFVHPERVDGMDIWRTDTRLKPGAM